VPGGAIYEKSQESRLQTYRRQRRANSPRNRSPRRPAPVFNTKGYAATSLSDLMEPTGLQKGGLYRHFDSKEELAQEAFDYAWERAFSEPSRECWARGLEASVVAVDLPGLSLNPQG